jgi:signal transduction histidine kinase
VIGYSRILLEEWLGALNNEQKDSLTSINRSGKHLLSLVNGVIDVSKIEAGKIQVFAEDFDLFDVVAESVRSFENDAKEKGVQLKFNAIHHPVHTDRTRLLQCLLNLVSNAIKFTEKGEITISADVPNGGEIVELSVSDTGIGMPETDLDKLFSPFHRLDSHLRSKTLGTGLGLYLTKKLVNEILKGEIAVKSSVGAGSRFVLKVPTHCPAMESSA